jgi:DUF4097 and DUF4098 domain-containing protein YvlB
LLGKGVENMRVSCLLALALVAEMASADDWSRNYELGGPAEVHVRTDDGNVRVEPGDGARVEARVTTTGWRIAPDEVVIVERQTGNRVELEVKLPKVRHGWTGHRSVEVALRMPARSDLEVRTGDGSVDVRGLAGRIQASTGDGDVVAAGIEGELRLHTGDGTIRASALGGRVSADTGDGDVDVRGRFDVLDLRTGDGNIDAGVDSGSRVAAPWSIRTGDGDVRLQLAQGLGAELDAQAGDGSIEVDRSLPLEGDVREKRVAARLGSGGERLTVRTGDGSIRLVSR